MFTFVRDHTGKVTGQLQSIDGGHITTIHDKTGKLLGRYDANNDTTYDASGRLIGKGNLLLTQLDMRREN